MVNLFGTSQASRKFIDLIQQESTQWPNYNPDRPIQPGDFGYIDRQTGQFMTKGNVYTHDLTKSLAQRYPVMDGNEREIRRIVSKTTKRGEVGTGPTVNVTALANASFTFDLSFTSSRNAFLALYRPIAKFMPIELRSLLAEDKVIAKFLKNEVLVMTVYHCPSYAYYLSSGNSERFAVRLGAEVPVITAPAVMAGGEAQAGFNFADAGGVFDNAHNAAHVFMPLYETTTVKECGRRESPKPDAKEEDIKYGLLTTDVPWNMLDDDGNEISFSDDSDDDSD